MDLNFIGKHCALQSCNVLDFLPTQCTCSRWFCKLHVSPDLHDCPCVTAQTPRPLESSPSSSLRIRPKCALSGCNKPLLVTGVTAVDLTLASEPSGAIQSSGCSGCQLDYCVDHRHMQSHACADLARADTVKHAAARAVLAQKTAATDGLASHTPVVVRRQRNVASDPQKLAQLQKVTLMKLRHKAVPADPKDKGSMVPIDRRLHVTVRLEMIGLPAKEAVLWFRKTTTVGKALDLIVKHFGITYTQDSTLHLKQSSAELERQVLLQNRLELSSQVEDGSTVALIGTQSNG